MNLCRLSKCRPESAVRSRALLAAVLLALVGPAAGQGGSRESGEGTLDPAPGGPDVDPDARALADRVARRAGRPALEKISALRFDFVVEAGGREVSRRTIVFDRAGRRARLELDTKRGTVSICVDLKDDRGVALLDGERVPRADESGLVAYGRRLVQNDLGWLLLPHRLLDDGVRLEALPDAELDGQQVRSLEVVPGEQAPIPPGDRYVLSIEPDTGDVRRFSFRTSEMKPEQPPLVFDWRGYSTVGGIRFSLERIQVGGSQRIRIENLAVLEEVDEALFAPLQDE